MAVSRSENEVSVHRAILHSRLFRENSLNARPRIPTVSFEGEVGRAISQCTAIEKVPAVRQLSRKGTSESGRTAARCRSAGGRLRRECGGRRNCMYVRPIYASNSLRPAPLNSKLFAADGEPAVVFPLSGFPLPTDGDGGAPPARVPPVQALPLLSAAARRPSVSACLPEMRAAARGRLWLFGLHGRLLRALLPRAAPSLPLKASTAFFRSVAFGGAIGCRLVQRHPVGAAPSSAPPPASRLSTAVDSSAESRRPPASGADSSPSPPSPTNNPSPPRRAPARG
jgi:hypothetical protein